MWIGKDSLLASDSVEKGGGCNVLRRSNVIRQNVDRGSNPGIVMVGKQVAADTTLDFNMHDHGLLIIFTWRG